jgi:hypothetical protein
MASTINASTSSGLVATADTSGVLQLQTGGTAAVTVNASQNVGIGTASPAQKFSIQGATFVGSSFNGQAIGDAAAERIRIGYKNGTPDTGLVPAQIISDAVLLQIASRDISSGEITFATGSGIPERMRIDYSGNLLVGTTSSSGSSGTGFKVTNPIAGHWDPAIVTGSNSGVTSCWDIYSTATSSYRFYVTTSGVVNAVSTTITAISDQRLKENVRDLDDGLNVVMALKPRKFDWKEGKGADIKNARGFVAQEFEQVLPDLIDEWKDPAPEGEEPYKAVRADLIPTLVKAIQEQQAVIQSLTDRVAQLEAK